MGNDGIDVSLMRQYVAVIEQGSFSAAARKLGVGQPAISKAVARLEDHLGVCLVLRSTRATRPTDAGRRFYEGCLEVFEAVATASQAARDEAVGSGGAIRVFAPELFGPAFLVPKLKGFLTGNPLVSLSLSTLSEGMDLVSQGADVAIFIGRPTQPDVIVRKVGMTRSALVCGPDLALRWADAIAPQDLMAAPAVVCSQGQPRLRWSFQDGGAKVAVRPEQNITVDSDSVALSAAACGHGLWMTTRLMVAEDLTAGRLCEILPRAAVPMPVYLGFAAGRTRPARVDAFAQWLGEELIAEG